MQKSHLPGELIRELRLRKGLRQAHLQDLSFDATDSQVTLSRIENLRQNPSTNTLHDLLSKVALPYWQFFCPHLEDQPAQSFVLRRQIFYLLDRAEGDAGVQAMAGRLIDTLRSHLDMDSRVNRQFWMGLRAACDTLAGRSDAQTMARIMEALRLTYPEFEADAPGGGVLIFYEGELMLCLARCHANAGDFDRALGVLAHLRDGHEKQPLSELHKEMLLSKIDVLTTRYLLEKGDYPAALAAGERALASAKKQSGRSRLPDAVFWHAVALFRATGEKERAAALMTQAYFAFALLKNPAMQRRVAQEADRLLGVQIETYGVACEAPALPPDFFDFKAGSALAAHSLGALLRQFRLASGAKQSEIYRGICSRSFYSRIESGQRTQVGIFMLEALMQRLGRDIDLYLEYFSSVAEWEESRLRVRYMREVYIGNTDEAQKTLEALRAIGDFSTGLGRQFLLTTQAMMQAARGELDGFDALVLEALRLTIPDFSEENVADQRLTYNECNLVNALAYYHVETGQVQRGIALYLRIKQSMDRFYVDDSIKARYYLTLLSNLALEHENTGQYAQALAFANEHESMSARHGVLHLMNEIAPIKARCLHKLGQKGQAAAYAAMAYFSGSLTASEQAVREIAQFADQALGLAFSPDPGFVFHAQKAGTYASKTAQG